MPTFGGVVSLGGLCRDGVVLPRATRPWLIDISMLRPYEGLPAGDIADFETAPAMARWSIGDTPDDPAQRLQWIKIVEAERTLLICDRVIMVRISWDDLDSADYVTGAPVTIDGMSYNCRLLSGGHMMREPADAYAGGAPLNEWDSFVAGDEPVAGLPRPEASDLDAVLTDQDLGSPHNRLWHWFGAVSWTQEPYSGRDTARCCRGYRSARYFYLNTHSHRHEDIGWRPVMEMSR